MLYSIFILIYISLQPASFRIILKYNIPVLSEGLKLHACFFRPGLIIGALRYEQENYLTFKVVVSAHIFFFECGIFEM